MRRSIWIIAILFAAIGAPRAHAQTSIVESDGIVTGIDNLPITSTEFGTVTYDVTFVVTDSPTITFTDSGDATTAAEDIADELNSSSDSFPNTLTDGYTFAWIPTNFSGITTTVSAIDTCVQQLIDSQCPSSYTYQARSAGSQNNDYAEFSPVVTPEPSTSVHMMSGFGLIALTLLEGVRLTVEG